MSHFYTDLRFYVRFSHFLGPCIAFTRQTRDQFDNICVTSNKLSIMNEYSSCCGASRHHIFDELCADCLEHCEFDEDYDELS